jgi:hypothetical protein
MTIPCRDSESRMKPRCEANVDEESSRSRVARFRTRRHTRVICHASPACFQSESFAFVVNKLIVICLSYLLKRRDAAKIPRRCGAKFGCDGAAGLRFER